MGWAMGDGKTEGTALFIRILGGAAWPQVESNCGTGRNSLLETALISALIVNWSAEDGQNIRRTPMKPNSGWRPSNYFSGTSTKRDNSGLQL
jgi:hypothetical protein